MRRKIESVLRLFPRAQRMFALVLALFVLASVVLTMVVTLDVVTVVDSEGNRHMLLTASRQPHQILEMAGVEAGPEDKIEFTEDEAGASVTVTRAFPVHLVVDGVTLLDEQAGGTVGELLAAHGVQLGDEDYVQPAADTQLYRGLRAVVHRVTYEQSVAEEVLDEAVVDQYVEALGTAETFVASLNGTYAVSWRHRLVDGLIVESAVIGLEALSTPQPAPTPRPQDSYEIIPGVPCSRIESFDDIEMDENGWPLNYTRLMSNAISTAYSSSGGKGSSGLGLYCGTVAVNPNVIPYGTRMYITSSDGTFIYGFAIATDTGTAMMEGYVDIDLYFETNAECLQFGKRPLDVYILD